MASDRRGHTWPRFYQRLFVAGLWLLLLPAGFATQALAASAAQSFITGLSVHLLSRPDRAAQAQPFIQELHAQSVRNDAPWARVETGPGEYRIPAEWDRYVDQQRQQDLMPLLILDYGHPRYDQGDKPTSPAAIAAFVRYATYVVRHFRGRVRLYEVWNEWDAATGRTTPGTPAAYARLLREVYPAIKAVDPDAIVLGGSVTADGLRGNGHHGLAKWLAGSATWLEQLLAQDVLEAMDGLSLHPYNYYAQGPQATPEGWLEWMQTLESGLRSAHGGRDVPLYITEMGWPVFTGRGGVSEQLAAAYMARTSLLARSTSFIKGIWWYQLNDEVVDTRDKENNFGLLRPDFTRKQSFTALAALTASIGPNRWVRRLPTLPQVPAVQGMYYGSDRPVGSLLWSVEPMQLRVRLRAGARLKQQALDGTAAQQVACSAGAGSEPYCGVTLSVTAVPLLIEGPPEAMQLGDAAPLAAQ